MGSKIDVNFERRFFKKPHFSEGKTTFFEIQQVQVGSKNGSKIDQKIKWKIQCILASIFKRFWSIFGAKLGRKIDQKSFPGALRRSQKPPQKLPEAARSSKNRNLADFTSPKEVPGRVRCVPARQQLPGPSRWGGVGEGSANYSGRF